MRRIYLICGVTLLDLCRYLSAVGRWFGTGGGATLNFALLCKVCKK